MTRLIVFIATIAGIVFLTLMLILYGFYFVSMVKEFSSPRQNPFTSEELIPLILAISFILSIPLAFIFAYLIRKLSRSKGIKHNLTRLMRVFFVGFIGVFIACFFISSVYVEQYIHTISAHHGYLMCIRNKDDMNYLEDIWVLPDSAEACARFQAGRL
jgi:MFS family permease